LHPNEYRKRLRTPEAAAYLRLSPSTLAKMRLTGYGPAYSKLGGRIVVYEISDLDEYAAARRRRSTSEPATVLDVTNGSRPSLAKADQKSPISSPSREQRAKHHRRPRDWRGSPRSKAVAYERPRVRTRATREKRPEPLPAGAFVLPVAALPEDE
jgi:hypothetical protein